MTKRTRPSIIGNLSNYDMDFDEDDINGSEGEDDYDEDYEPEEPVEDYRETNDRNYPNNDPRW